jgi:uncharacterized SAM-binding protein YcdF (DUF218 family)
VDQQAGSLGHLVWQFHHCIAIQSMANPTVLTREAVLMFESACLALEAAKTSKRTSRWRRRVRRSVISTCLLLTAAVISALPVYVRPQIDQLRHADAILILGGFGDGRYSYGMDLAAQGWTPNVVVSNPNGTRNLEQTEFCAAAPPRAHVHCFVPDPPTTKGEGRELRRLASQYGWRTVIVVTLRAHISRARFILERCFDGDLVMRASPDRISIPRWAFEYLYQTAGYARTVLQPGC